MKAQRVKKHLWMAIETMPPYETVEVLTVYGIVCLARSVGPVSTRPADGYGPRRAYCKRVDLPEGRTGDVMAVLWRYPTEERRTMYTGKGTELRSVGMPSGGDYVVGEMEWECKSIVLHTDGHGVGGYYDRIHITTNTGRYFIVPAHQAMWWEVTNEPESES